MTDKFPEIYAAEILQSVLGVRVDPHDDGTEDGMPDLILRTADGDRFVEVVSDVAPSERRMESRMKRAAEVLARKRLPQPGTWSVCLAADAEVHTARKALPHLIARAPEAAAAAGVSVDRALEIEGAAEAGILSIQRIDDEPPEGAVQMYSIPDRGALVAPPGDLATWVEEMFDRHRDVAAKLAGAGAVDAHAFFLATGTSDGGVNGSLYFAAEVLPTRDPVVPEPVSTVWVATSITRRHVLRWTAGVGWERMPWITKPEHEDLR